jgi:hypothetical protein
VHARIDGDVRAERDSGSSGGVVERAGVVLRKEGLDQVKVRKLCGKGRGGTAENQNVGVSVCFVAGGAYGDRLIKGGNRKKIAPLAEKRANAGRSTVPISVGFDDGDDAGRTVGANVRTERAVVMRQGVEVDLCVSHVIFTLRQRGIQTVEIVHGIASKWGSFWRCSEAMDADATKNSILPSLYHERTKIAIVLRKKIKMSTKKRQKLQNGAKGWLLPKLLLSFVFLFLWGNFLQKVSPHPFKNL